MTPAGFSRANPYLATIFTEESNQGVTSMSKTKPKQPERAQPAEVRFAKSSQGFWQRQSLGPASAVRRIPVEQWLAEHHDDARNLAD
jgi:hypothetical protein